MGRNATLDHITPKSRCFSNSIENLVWADRSINNMKGDCTIEEFERLMKKVLRKMGYGIRKKR